MRWCMLVLWRVFAGSDLESVIEEIRKDVVGRRCRVNITEVEKLALALSQLSRSLASLKSLCVFFTFIPSFFRRSDAVVHQEAC